MLILEKEMYLLIVRHGQSEDDLIAAYGGWIDFPLTAEGKLQLEKTAKEIHNLDVKFERILTSPLSRAKESAQIISGQTGLEIEVFEYLKERNTYGLLSGMVKDEAKAKYPWLVDAYNTGQYVEASEREEDVKHRARKTFELISSRKEKALLIVTHGNFLKAFFSENLNKKLIKKDDGGFILLKLTSNSTEIITFKGIEIE